MRRNSTVRSNFGLMAARGRSSFAISNLREWLRTRQRRARHS